LTPTFDVHRFITAVGPALEEEMSGSFLLRRQIHRAPELSWHEHATSARIADALPRIKIESVAETGILARVGGSNHPAIGVRAELDALPIREETGAPFAATGDAMHACGHDVHAAALVALLNAFSRVSRPDPPPVSLLGIFQPSEEAEPSGAEAIIKSGRLQDHNVAAMLAVHLHPRVAWGSVTTGAGAVNASSDTFTVTITGAGGHGAYPHEANDPILALSAVVVALQQIVSRRTDPMHPVVLSLGRLNAGTAANVIPAEAMAEGTLRVLAQDDRTDIQSLMADVAAHTAAAHGCQAAVTFCEGDPALTNDAGLVAVADDWLSAAGLSVAVPMRSCGSDDFASYQQLAPSLMMFLGLHRDGHDNPGLHHSRFLPPEESVRHAARTMLAAFGAAAQLTLDGQVAGSPGPGSESI
jgi:amidohydrolase